MDSAEISPHTTTVVLDAANITFYKAHHAIDRLLVAIDYFKNLYNLRCIAFAPNFWVASSNTNSMLSSSDADIVRHLVEQEIVVLTPSHAHDDYYVLDYAVKHDGFIVTNDLFRDHVAEERIFQGQQLTTEWVRERCIDYSFCGKEFLPNPTALQRVLRHKGREISGVRDTMEHAQSMISLVKQAEAPKVIQKRERRREIDLSAVTYYPISRMLLPFFHEKKKEWEELQDFTNTYIVLPAINTGAPLSNENFTLSIYGNEMGRLHAVQVLNNYIAQVHPEYCVPFQQSLQDHRMDDAEVKEEEVSMEIED